MKTISLLLFIPAVITACTQSPESVSSIPKQEPGENIRVDLEHKPSKDSLIDLAKKFKEETGRDSAWIDFFIPSIYKGPFRGSEEPWATVIYPGAGADFELLVRGTTREQEKALKACRPADTSAMLVGKWYVYSPFSEANIFMIERNGKFYLEEFRKADLNGYESTEVQSRGPEELIKDNNGRYSRPSGFYCEMNDNKELLLYAVDSMIYAKGIPVP